MKTKPKEAIKRIASQLSDGVAFREDWARVIEFTQSLPDEFDIVEPRKVQVEWPKELTRERLEELACRCDDSNQFSSADALRALAAVAPKKRTRMVNLWRYHGDTAFYESENKPESGDPAKWRKVNASPVEIED